MNLIDLSLTIQSHWRWPIKQEYVMSHSQADPYQATVINLPMHAFTHIDTPLHISPDKITVDEIPLERLIGSAAVLNLTYIEANQKIDRSDLEKAGSHICKDDIVLLKTTWDLKRDPMSRQYWTEAPYVSESAAIWLAELPVKAVGFDFPQDYVIREIPQRHPRSEEMPTHHHILRKGIYLIEYLCNLGRVDRKRIDFFAAPLKVGNAEGAPARAFAMSN